jgi:hypothetical protein
VTTHQFSKKRVEEGPGTIGVISGELARYSHFSVAMLHLQVPDGSKLAWDPSANITGQCNDLVKFARRTEAEWLWIIGDDHVFQPDIIHKLLAHNVDVVVPNCLQKSAPFSPVIYKGLNEQGHHALEMDPPETGLHQIFAAGSAGMLIRRHVLDALPIRPFTTTGGHQNEDLEFCRAVREAGFEIWCDVETHLGHIGTTVVWPHYMEEYGWGAILDLGPPVEGREQRMPIRRIAKGPSLTAA